MIIFIIIINFNSSHIIMYYRKNFSCKRDSQKNKEIKKCGEIGEKCTINSIGCMVYRLTMGCEVSADLDMYGIGLS